VQVKDVSGFPKDLMKDEDMVKISKLFNKIKTGKKKLIAGDYQMIEIKNEEHACHGVELMNIESCEPENPECDSNSMKFYKTRHFTHQFSTHSSLQR
jgi:hypothetical protein